MGVLKSVLGYVDTEHYTYGELFNEINAQTGGINCGLQVFRIPENDDDCRRMFGIRAKFLYDKLDFVMKMIEEILNTSRLGDEKRLHEIISSMKSGLQNRLSSAGNATAVMRAASYYSPMSNFQDRIAGIGFYQLLKIWTRTSMRKNAELIKNSADPDEIHLPQRESDRLLYRRRDRLRTAGRKNRSIQRESVHRRSGAGQHCV